YLFGTFAAIQEKSRIGFGMFRSLGSYAADSREYPRAVIHFSTTSRCVPRGSSVAISSSNCCTSLSGEFLRSFMAARTAIRPVIATRHQNRYFFCLLIAIVIDDAPQEGLPVGERLRPGR